MVKLGVCDDSESIASICFAQKPLILQKTDPQNPQNVMSHHFSQWFSDESSLFTVLWELFFAQGMFFMQKIMLAMDQNHNKPLV